MLYFDDLPQQRGFFGQQVKDVPGFRFGLLQSQSPAHAFVQQPRGADAGQRTPGRRTARHLLHHVVQRLLDETLVIPLFQQWVGGNFLPFFRTARIRPGHVYPADTHTVFFRFGVGDGDFPAGLVHPELCPAPENAHHVRQVVGELRRGGQEGNGWVHGKAPYCGKYAEWKRECRVQMIK